MKRIMSVQHNIVLFVLALTLLVSCKKGDQGPAGPSGPMGAKGDSGLAGVISSSWLDLLLTPDTAHIGDFIDTIGYHADINAPKLTLNMLTSGEVKMYVNKGTVLVPEIFLLPYSDNSGLSIIPIFSPQRIRLTTNADLSTSTINGQKYFQYRYILAPGIVNARQMNELNWSNYSSVKAWLRLPD